MENCKLVAELNRLRKSSRDSIDGIGDFGDFKNICTFQEMLKKN